MEPMNFFADVTEDHQFIHIDKEAATPLFGSTIAHGFLSLSLLPHLSSQAGSLIPENIKAGISEVKINLEKNINLMIMLY